MTIIASEITNIHSPNENSSWSQATLPVRSGGLGIRKAVQVAPSAYISGFNCFLHWPSVLHCPTHLRNVPLPTCEEVKGSRHSGQEVTATRALRNEARPCQRSWDSVTVTSAADKLLSLHPAGPRPWAKESGAWLEALPISSLGLHMEDHACKQSEWQLVCAWAPPYVLPTPVVTVGQKLMPYRWQDISMHMY